MLIIVMGLPGTGKTYFAKALAKKIDGVHFNSDNVRKALYEKPAYTGSDKGLVYKTMFDKVCVALKKHYFVIVDATFSLARYRDPYLNHVANNMIPLRIFQIEADEDTIAKRIAEKRPDSDADFKVYQKIKSEFETLEMNQKVLKSDQLSLKKMLEQALEFINNSV